MRSVLICQTVWAAAAIVPHIHGLNTLQCHSPGMLLGILCFVDQVVDTHAHKMCTRNSKIGPADEIP